jgi:glyoxylase-like metal-dependent hydrolase (beta-lactamase superfamily II)
MSNQWRAEVLLEGTGYSSTCTLVTNREHRIVIDTGLSIQESALVRALAGKQLAPADIDIVINTHLHVDHCGNNSIFSHAAIFMSQVEWAWTRHFYEALFASRTPERVALEFYPEVESYGLSTRTVRNVARMARMFWHPERVGREHEFKWLETSSLPLGLELLATPGHTPHHVSIRVNGSSPNIVAGDAVLAEDADAKVKTMIPFSRAQFLATRHTLLERGEMIIPGHGPAFLPARRGTDPVFTKNAKTGSDPFF